MIKITGLSSAYIGKRNIQFFYLSIKKQKDKFFFFIDVLSKILGKNLTIVTDMGTSFTCTMQSFKCKKNQRLFTSSGLAYGYGIPGSIGASFANNKKQDNLYFGRRGSNVQYTRVTNNCSSSTTNKDFHLK